MNENDPSHVDYLSGIYDCIFERKTTSVYPQFSCFYDYKLSKTKQWVWATYLQVIQEFFYLIASPLCAIFNQSIISGVFPDEWKLSKLSLCLHVFKHGKRFNLN